MSRKNEAKWVASANRWQINVQLEGRRRTFTSSIKGLKGKIAAEKKADAWLENRLIDETSTCTVLLDKYFASLQASTSAGHWKQQKNLDLKKMRSCSLVRHVQRQSDVII